jgi:GNAT superfamily N-acetyltransferase
MAIEQLDKQALIEVRNYRPADKNFIMATWLRGLYYGDSWFSQIPKAIFMEQYHAALEKFLLGQAVIIKIACLKEDPEVILGYSVSRNLQIGEASISVLDWVFVKSAWRKIGIGKMLMPHRINACTHLTKSGQAIARQKLPDMIFNPFIFV